ncbi:MAG: hypothetical protein KDK51_04840, partial [Deltaproteobacteria bacterium]|nr:hypothetical protein [Deltaproteobacteria bacterium]
MVETISMAKYFDYFDIENDHLFLMDGSVSKIFKIECLDPSSMTKEELLALNDKIAGLCQMVEKGIDLQIFFRSKNRYEKGLKLYDQYLETMRMDSRFASRLSLSKIDSLRSSNLFCSDIYVIINVHRFFDKKKSVETFDINKKHLDKICNNINAYLQDISRGVKSLEENEIANFLYECLNPGRWENIQEFNYKGKNSMIFDETLRSKLNFHGYLFNKDHFYAEGRYGQCINLLNLPEETYPAMFFDLLSGFEKAFEFNFSYRISAVNQTAVVSFQDGMRNVYKSLLNTSLLGSDNTNYAVEKKMTENEQFLSAVSDGQQRIYEVGLCLTHYADTYENLTYQSDMILRSFRLLNGCDGFVEEYNQQKTFISSLPASRAHLEKPFKFLTDNVADFSPLYEPYKGTEKPTLLLRNRFNGIIKFDPFSAKDVQNYNAIVCGKSGSGKSFLISHICQTFIAQGYPVIFVDIGGSFKRTVECFSGQYFDLNENVSINPLFPKSQVEKNGVISTVA